MSFRRVMLLLAVLVIAVAGTVLAARPKHATEVIPSQGAKDAVIDVEFAAGTIVISPKDMADIAQLDVTYDPAEVDLIVEKDLRNETMYFSVESDFESHNHDNDNDIDNDWEMGVSTRFPMELHMEMGACKAEIDLGGVPLTELSIEIGAASGAVDFSSPNPRRLKEFKIEAGASSIDLINLGNANFEHFKFNGGAGAFDMDLRGKYTGDCEVEIEVGLGSADIILPRDVPVRIETDDDRWFSSVDLHGGDLDELRDGVYESPGFDKATTRLTIRLEVGMGSVDVRWKN